MPEKTKKIDKWRLPLIVGVLVVLAAVIAVGIGALIAHDRKPQPTPAAFASSSPTRSAAAPVGDPHARRACELNRLAEEQDKLHDVPAIQAIFDEADQSKNFDIKFAAQMLYDKQKISNREIARGAGNLDLVLAVNGASTQMQIVCLNAGYA